MSALREKKMAQIRGLLAKAEDPAATEAERETYTAKAFELMARYQVERADLGEGAPITAAGVECRKFFIVRNPYMVGKEQLIVRVASAFGMQTVYRSNQYQRAEDGSMVLDAKGRSIPGKVAEVWGFPEDLEMLDVMYTSLLMQVTMGIEADRPQMLADCPHPGHQIPWKNSWTTAFANTVAWRLEESRRKVANENDGAGGLVLVRSDDAIIEAFNKAYPRLRSAKRRSIQGHAGARQLGRAAGQRADIGGSRMGAATAKALSS